MSELEELYMEIENALSVTMNEGLQTWDKERNRDALSWDEETRPLPLTWKGKFYMLTITPEKE